MKILFYDKGGCGIAIENLSSYLKRGGHKTDLHFDPGFENNHFFDIPFLKFLNSSISDKIRKFSPDLICFSSITNNYNALCEIANEVKKQFDIPIIFGGIHPTTLPEIVIKNKNIDFLCRGEGEEALLELVNSLESKELNYRIQNIWFKKREKIIKNKIRPLIDNLNKLPFPDKELSYKHGLFTDMITVLCGRGCPHTCSYCSSSYFYHRFYKNNIVRKRSVNNVIEEIKHYLTKYKIKKIDFHDDVFITSSKWLMEFSRKYKKEINLPFRCQTHPNVVNKENIKLLKDANCKIIFMAIDSGDKNIMHNILKRKISFDKIIDSADLIKKSKIKLQTTAMFAIPGETSKEMYKTVKMIEKIKPDIISSYTFYPFPKTPLTELAINKKYINKENLEEYHNGKKSFHKKSILNHPYKDIAYNMSKLLPLYNKSGKIGKKILERMFYMKNEIIPNMLFTLTIPYTFPWQGRQRIKESINIFRKKIKRYKN